MTTGIERQKAFGLKSVPRATMTPWSIILRTGGGLSLRMQAVVGRMTPEKRKKIGFSVKSMAARKKNREINYIYLKIVAACDYNNDCDFP